MAAAVVGAALLTGCSEKQEANDTLPSSSPSETAEALLELGPADFPVPDEARTKDAAGAEAFLRYYVDLLNRQQSIPSGEALRELGSECQDCLRIAQDLDESAASGLKYRGGELSIVGEFGTAVSDEGANLSFIARINAGVQLDSSGTPVPGTESAAVERLPSGASLSWSATDESWLIDALSIG